VRKSTFNLSLLAYDSKTLIEKRKPSVNGLVSILQKQGRSTKGGSIKKNYDEKY
jgi:hypothetical protein